MSCRVVFAPIPTHPISTWLMPPHAFCICNPSPSPPSSPSSPSSFVPSLLRPLPPSSPSFRSSSQPLRSPPSYPTPPPVNEEFRHRQKMSVGSGSCPVLRSHTHSPNVYRRHCMRDSRTIDRRLFGWPGRAGCSQNTPRPTIYVSQL